MTALEKARRSAQRVTLKAGTVVVETISLPSALEGVKIAGKRGSGAESTVNYDRLLGEDVRAYNSYIIKKRLGSKLAG